MNFNIPKNPAEDFKARFEQAAELFGGAEYIPASNLFLLSERLRGHHVVEKALANNENVLKELKNHSVFPEIIGEIIGEEVIVEEAKPRPKNAKSAAEAWVKENAGKTVSSNEICDATGLSYQQVNKWIKDRPDLFSKLQKGKYLLRNPDKERAEAK